MMADETNMIDQLRSNQQAAILADMHEDLLKTFFKLRRINRVQLSDDQLDHLHFLRGLLYESINELERLLKERQHGN